MRIPDIRFISKFLLSILYLSDLSIFGHTVSNIFALRLDSNLLKLATFVIVPKYLIHFGLFLGAVNNLLINAELLDRVRMESPHNASAVYSN